MLTDCELLLQVSLPAARNIWAMKKWIGAWMLSQCLGLAAWGQLLDSDGDGYPDDWESQGVTVRGVFLDLPAMGANPLHKDIFVQVDYMVADDHTHQPKRESLKRIVTCFADAPVSNPDGTSGIQIHIDAGPDSIMTGNRTWAGLSRSHELPHADSFGVVNARGWPDFISVDQLKAVNLPPERVGVFRYCLYVHNLTGQGSTSGYARQIPSDDFIVSLGGWLGKEGTVTEQSGTFVHELGHTLGLRHGGPNHVHRKPNYFSVMNYLFQSRGLRVNQRDGLLDFSRSATPALDEFNLNENLGVAGAPAHFGTRWFIQENGRRKELFVNFANRAIDWNADGVLTNSISHDLNDDGREELLESQNDWTSVVYAAGSVGQQTPRRIEPEDIEGELDLLQDEEIATEYEVSVDSQGNASADPGRQAVLRFLVSNHGTQADSYTLTAFSEHHWNVTASPASVALAPGASQEVQVTVSLPGGTIPGVEDEVELLARSGDLVDSDVEKVVTAGTIPDLNGSGGPNFQSGSSGCFVATAAYGSYLDPHVVTLRKFRDDCLLPVTPGLVDFYYRHSPPLARSVARHSWLRAGAVAALTPLVLALEHPWSSSLLLFSALVLMRRQRRGQRT